MDLDGSQTPPSGKKGWIIAITAFIITMMVFEYIHSSRVQEQLDKDLIEAVNRLERVNPEVAKRIRDSLKVSKIQ